MTEVVGVRGYARRGKTIHEYWRHAPRNELVRALPGTYVSPAAEAEARKLVSAAIRNSEAAMESDTREEAFVNESDSHYQWARAKQLVGEQRVHAMARRLGY